MLKLGSIFTDIIFMTNSEIVQKIADGYRVHEIAKEFGVNRRTLEDRILTLRKQCMCETVSHLVAKYFRLKLIE